MILFNSHTFKHILPVEYIIFTVIINPFFSAIVDLDARFDPIKQAVLKNYQHWRQESGEASTKRRLSHIKLILNGEDINDDQTEEEKENKSEAVTIEIDPNAEEKVTAFDNTDTSSFDETKSKSKEILFNSTLFVHFTFYYHWYYYF